MAIWLKIDPEADDADWLLNEGDVDGLPSAVSLMVERRERSPKEISKDDAEGVAAWLTATRVYWPDVEHGVSLSEGPVPRAVRSVS